MAPANAAESFAVAGSGGRLFASNHRTLLDPIAVSCGLCQFSELASPIRTVRQGRGPPAHGGATPPRRRRRRVPLRHHMPRAVPAPVQPALRRARRRGDPRRDVFYGASTKPSAKWLEAVCFLMNMRPGYRVEFLMPVATTTVAVGGDDGRRIAVGNMVQRMIGEALGYELTKLTRKDKVRNDGREGTERRKDKAWSLGI
ncbi:hypothetical protein EJB05_02709, partial [Eragrostis curvula]